MGDPVKAAWVAQGGTVKVPVGPGGPRLTAPGGGQQKSERLRLWRFIRA